MQEFIFIVFVAHFFSFFFCHFTAIFFSFFLTTKKEKAQKLGSRRAMRQKWVHILMRAAMWDNFFFLGLRSKIFNLIVTEKIMLAMEIRGVGQAAWETHTNFQGTKADDNNLT